jgi:hypothetical protein
MDGGTQKYYFVDDDGETYFTNVNCKPTTGTQ